MLLFIILLFIISIIYVCYSYNHIIKAGVRYLTFIAQSIFHSLCCIWTPYNCKCGLNKSHELNKSVHFAEPIAQLFHI